MFVSVIIISYGNLKENKYGTRSLLKISNCQNSYSFPLKTLKEKSTERQGFEPWDPMKDQLISSQLHSATLPPLPVKISLKFCRGKLIPPEILTGLGIPPLAECRAYHILLKFAEVNLISSEI